MKPASANLEKAPTPLPDPVEVPVWMQRSFIVSYVLVCIWLGVVLVLLPWSPLWSTNSLLVRWPNLYRFLQHGFVRGVVSGLGLVDIWIGLLEAVQYHDQPVSKHDPKFQ